MWPKGENGSWPCIQLISLELMVKICCESSIQSIYRNQETLNQTNTIPNLLNLYHLIKRKKNFHRQNLRKYVIFTSKTTLKKIVTKVIQFRYCQIIFFELLFHDTSNSMGIKSSLLLLNLCNSCGLPKLLIYSMCPYEKNAKN